MLKKGCSYVLVVDEVDRDYYHKQVKAALRKKQAEAPPAIL